MNLIKVNKKIYNFLLDTKKRKNFLLGGAGSGKSYAIAQFLILNKLFSESNISILVVSKVRPSVKIPYQLVLDLLAEYGFDYKLNKTDLEIRNGSNIMYFKGLDDPEKIKSAEFNYIWCEEATSLNINDYRQLNLRMRRKNQHGMNQMYLSFNPIDMQNYLYEIVENPMSEMAVHRSMYKDNAFLQQEYIKELEELKNQDATYNKIYALGEWATPTDLIYTNWDIVDKKPDKIDETIYGLDFGFNNPSALVRIDVCDKELYISEDLYQTELTNQDLIGRLESLIKDKKEIYADCAEPARIEEIKRAGFNVKESDKDVNKGIDSVKTMKVHIMDSSVNLIKEIRGYKWKQDKDSNVLDEPVKFNDHLLDALRYAVYTHLGKTRPEPKLFFV